VTALVPGLVSVTFRRLGPRQIVSLAVDGGLRAVEWGGDVHVPAGDLRAAQEVAALCADSGVAVAAYGSYHRADADFTPVLETALALGAPRVRVWAGRVGSAGETDRAAVVDGLREAVEKAGGHAVAVAVEYHANTLTDTVASAVQLLTEVPGLEPYWQPPVGCSPHDALVAVAALSPVAAHVFSWDDAGRRLPLAAREDLWRPVLAELAKLPGTRHVLLEFVRDDDPAAFVEDATVLREWLATPGWGDDT
jgi:xylose isomerase-like TIM barrel protein